MLELAIEIAVKAHMGQIDKSGQPYILHPLRVMMRVEGELLRTAAVLHDVIEDCDISKQDLANQGIKRNVLDILECVTRRNEETYEEFVERTATNPGAILVKIADLEDNMDLCRITHFDEKTGERLERYNKAWHFLKSKSG